MNIITCAGYGSTGSSAVTDYVSEFSSVYSVGSSVEFNLLSAPDGIFTLERAVTSGVWTLADIAISRFLLFFNDFKNRFYFLFNDEIEKCLNDYFNELNLITWNGGWNGSINMRNDYGLNRSFQKALFQNELNKKKYSLYETETAPWQPTWYPGCKQNYVYCSKESFRKATRNFINSILMNILADNKPEYVMLDQLCPPSSGIDYSDYIENLKVICVDSNPIDLYLRNSLVYGERYIPYENVDTFINWYKQTRFHRKIEKKCSNYLYINFESMVYNYDKTSKQINEFLGLSKNSHINQFKYFNPEKSIQNTNLEQKFILSEQLKSDVEKIKKELNEYLFSFPTVSNIKKVKEYPISEIRQKSDRIGFQKSKKISLIHTALLIFIKDSFIKYLKNYFKISTKRELDVFRKKHSILFIIKIVFIFVLLPKDLFSYLFDCIFLKNYGEKK